MELNTQQLANLHNLFLGLDESQRSAFLAWAAEYANASNSDGTITAETIEEFISKQHPRVVCPFCGSFHIVKNGHRNGHQRFICKNCGKTFGMTHNTILHKTKKEFSTWNLYIDCMMKKMPLRDTVSICHINLSTAFAWRHKILDALTNMMNAIKMGGVVECDETYQLISYKGNHKNSKHFTMPRASRGHGGKATKRGLSDEQVCITCGVNLDHMSVGRISNLGKPSCKDLGSVLDGHIEAGSVFVTDSHRGFCKLANTYGVSHIRIPRNRHTAQGFNIQTANYYHSALKAMVNIRFRGVSTKYLNNYVVWHSFVNFARGSAEKKQNAMRNFVFTTACKSLWKKNQNRPAIPCVA